MKTFHIRYIIDGKNIFSKCVILKRCISERMGWKICIRDILLFLTRGATLRYSIESGNTVDIKLSCTQNLLITFT